MYWGDKPRLGFNKGQKGFWSYLEMKVSGPQDLEGVYRFIQIKNKNGRYEKKYVSEEDFAAE